MTFLRNALMCQRERRARQDLSTFAKLIATPGDLSVGVTLPANAVLFMSTTSALAAVTLLLDVDGRSIGGRVSAAGTQLEAGWFERARIIKKHTGAPGVVSVYVQDGVGALHKIAQG